MRVFKNSKILYFFLFTLIILSGLIIAPTSSQAQLKSMAVPSIEVTVNGAAIYSGYSLSTSPEVYIRITDSDGIDIDTFHIILNSTYIIGDYITMESTATTYAVLYTPSLLVGNIYTLAVEVYDNISERGYVEFTQLSVKDVIQIIGTPMNYPNPFSPRSSQTTTIKYELTKETNMNLIIYDTTGRMVARKFYLSGSNGGSPGANYITWNGLSDADELLANGAYLYFLIANGQVLGRGAIAIYD